MDKVLRLGIIGLGRRWHKRYKPALRVLREGFAVRALCDQIQERATREARRMACASAAGPTQLLERDDVDAILLLDDQWFRLWPVERACEVGKPLVCAASLEQDDAHADRLYGQVQGRRLRIMMEMMPRVAPVTARLRTLLETELGAPRLLFCEVHRPGQVVSEREFGRAAEPGRVASLVGGRGIALLDWCAGLLGEEPLNVTARSLQPGGFSSLLLEFAGGRGVQVIHRNWVADRPMLRLQVLAERGSALVEWPHQVSWATREGFYSHALRRQRPLTQLLLERFREAVQEDRPPEPSLGDAYRVLGWLRLAACSQEEGRVVPITS